MAGESHLYAVILAGGSGTRFWPLSRESMPKQLLRIGGEEPLIRQTLLRILPRVPPARIRVVTHARQWEQIRFQVPELGPEAVILEPEGRNTAPAIGLAALHLMREDPEAIMAVLPADHLIQRPEAFLEALDQAVPLARAGHLVTLGIVPTRPETGYGWIQAGPPLENGAGGARVVARFVEKPDRDTALRFLEAGDYYWNSGMFVWQAAVILEEIQTHMPALHEALEEIQSLLGREAAEEGVRQVFRRIRPESIDYGVMEKSRRSVVIPVEAGWSDVGTWAALYEIAGEAGRDAGGNVIHGDVVSLDNQGCLFYADGGRLVAAVGLRDMMVVDTEDATLVCPRDRAQEVRRVVEELRRRGREEHRSHPTVVRPWGTYTVLYRGGHFQVKRILVHPGASLSYQIHHHRSEHWVVLSGTARVTLDDQVHLLYPHQSIDIPAGARHRLENPGRIPLQIIEVQHGEYLGEDDILRLEDRYGRS